LRSSARIVDRLAYAGATQPTTSGASAQTTASFAPMSIVMKAPWTGWERRRAFASAPWCRARRFRHALPRPAADLPFAEHACRRRAGAADVHELQRRGPRPRVRPDPLGKSL